LVKDKRRVDFSNLRRHISYREYATEKPQVFTVKLTRNIERADIGRGTRTWAARPLEKRPEMGE